MKLEKGIYTDCRERDQPEGTYRYAKNMLDNNTTGAKENEPGFEFLATLPQLNSLTTYVIGVIPIGTAFVVFLTNNTNHEIGLWNGSYSTIYNNNDLNFSNTTPIKGEYRINVEGERTIVWVDDANPPRILNIDNTSTVDSVEDLNIFQEVINPTLSTATISNTGGALLTGAYIPITRYRDIEGGTTAWFVHDRVLYITDDSNSNSFETIDGAEPGTLSNKSISLLFTNLDDRYDTVDIGYISVIGGIRRAFLASERDNATNLTHIITGSEQLEELALTEVLTPPSSYLTAKAITQVNGQLILGNLTSEDIPDLQQYALGIRINYTHSLVSVISQTNNHKDTLPPTFMPGEVYAFYLGVELKNGGWAFYHIPGRAPISSDNVIYSSTYLTGPNYQLLDTSNKGSFGATTNMGYWQNTSETYPNHTAFDGSGVGNADLRGQPVRHHRFPNMAALLTNHYSANSTVGITHLPRLGINITNVVIPSEIQEKITRWKIFFAKKDISNTTVIGSDILQYGVKELDNPSSSWASGGNWRLEAEQAGDGTWPDLSPVDTSKLRSHALDLLFKPATAEPTFIRPFYRLRRTNLNNPWTGFRSQGGKLTETGEDRGQVQGVVVDYTVPTVTTRAPTIGGAPTALLDFRFVPHNVIDGVDKTIATEGVFIGTIPIPSQLTVFGLDLNGQIRTNSPNQDSDNTVITTGYEDTVYYNFERQLSNVHVSFMTQDLIPTVGYATPSANTLSNVYGGDSFLCYMSYIACGPKHGNIETAAEGDQQYQGIRAWKGYIGYSRNNWNYRHESPGIISTKYMGKTSPAELFVPVADDVNDEYISLVSTLETLNELRYNEDYSVVNDFFAPVIFNPNAPRATQFPTTVIWSEIQNEEGVDSSWRSFPSGNRYVMPKNKGEIVNLQGVGNRDIIIHHEFSLFKTRTDMSIKTGSGEDVFLSSNDFFTVKPEEILSSDNGYAGTQNKLACKLTKAGYAFVDDLQGKIFLYHGEKLEEISAFGNRQLFRDNMNVRADNAYNGHGYNIAFDERYNRLIVSKKHTNSWTASFNPEKKVWVSFHSYVPDLLLSTVDNTVYSFTGRNLYKHNTGARGVFYGVLYPSFIDPVFKSNEDLLFYGLRWVSEVYGTDGIPIYGETLTHLSVSDLTHSTGRTILTPHTNYDSLYDSNCRIVNDSWEFNGIRDLAIAQGIRQGLYEDFTINTLKLNTSMEWHDQRKFNGKFVICRLEYSNNGSKTIYLFDVQPLVRYAP